MKHETFDFIFERQVQQSREVLLKKAGEYSADEDRLHNFRVAAALTNGTPESALFGMLAKHLVSVSDMVQGGSYSSAMWDEKIGDAINYLILLRAIAFDNDPASLLGENNL